MTEKYNSKYSRWEAALTDNTQPIEAAPLDGRWLLVRDPSRKYPVTQHGPWVIASRCDIGSGWCDDEGNEVEPTHWVPLPDPQPEPTKWLPAEGTICIEEITGDGWTSNGKPVTVSWRWLIYIERPDGSFDEYRDQDLANTLEQAQAIVAQRWTDRYSLPVVVRPLESKVVSLPTRAKRLPPPSGPEAA